MKLSRVTERIKPSLTRQLFNKAKEYNNVIDLTLGDPDFFTAPNVSESGCNAINTGRTKYSMNAGIYELRKAITDCIAEDYGVKYNPQTEAIVTVGAMGALYLTMKCIIDIGDEVIIPAPYWINYVQQVEMCGGKPVIVNSYEEDNFNIKVENLEKAITEKTKAIVVNSPNNPTGQVLTKEVMEDIAELAVKNDLIVIADEAYKELIYDDCKYTSIISCRCMRERTIIVNSFSKTYSMTGWRIGYAVAPEEIISKMTALQENIFACAPMPSQYAALEALNGPKDYIRYMVDQFTKRRNALVDGIFDEDLYQELCAALLQCIRMFTI